jgi:hypothetical protein
MHPSRMKSLKQIITLLWVFGAGLAALRADLIPPSEKWIQHTVRFANAKELTEYVLYIFPRDLDRNSPGNSSVRVPANGVVGISGLNPLAVAQAKGIYLFAIPITLHGSRERLPDENWFTKDTTGVLKCKLPSGQIRNLPRTDPRDKVEDVYEIRGLPKQLEVIRVETKESAVVTPPRIDRGATAILAGISVLAMVALVTHSRSGSRGRR